MRILILSDLHIEFHEDEGKSLLSQLCKKVDAVVIAGDLSVNDELPEDIKKICGLYKDVIFVNGNHELYHSSPEEFKDIKSKCIDENINLHWLDNSSVDVNGIRFVGATLWFEHDVMNFLYEKQLNDFNLIRNFVPWVYEQNENSLEYLNKNVTKKTIVVTHHLPSFSCVENLYKTSNLNRFYVSNQAHNIIQEKEPPVWIHGHSHSSFDKKIHKTRVIRNPFGYAGYEINPNFDLEKTIDIFL